MLYEPMTRAGALALRLTLAALAGALAPASAQAAAACEAASGPARAALVELYTSEGCSSCPPAERWLASLAGAAAARRLVPLAFHVDYWDYIGWKDPYASPSWSERQRASAASRGTRLVYTPQVLLDGRDWRDWGNPAALAQALDAGGPPRAELHLSATDLGEGRWRLELGGRSQQVDAALFVAVYENGLASHVTRGENAGATLRHEFVVRELIGPLAAAADGGFAHTLTLRVAPPARASGFAAFVQARRDGRVLQALALPACG